MNGIEPHIANEITQLLAIYIPQQHKLLAAALALGSGARKAVKGIWEKLRNKSEQEGSITEDAITAFATNPTELEHYL